TTVVWAKNLSEKSILEGVKSGNVYLKTDTAVDPDISFYAELDDQQWPMGSIIPIENFSEEPIHFTVSTASQKKLTAEWILNGEVIDMQDTPQISENGHVSFTYTLNKPVEGWLRLNLRQNREITIITNPVYLK
ncbi:MAG: hypothetical protein RI573_19245, partial [Balneolaceae bacterium]|nr:hypothetical protein [Balneolaceae bacterium]